MPNETDNNYPQEPQGFLGSAFGLGFGLAKFSYSWSALEMLRDAPRRGYYVPWTKAGKGGGGMIHGTGKRFGLWGKRGLMLGRPNPRAAKLYSDVGMGGLRHVLATNAIVSKFAPKVGPVAALSMARGAAGASLIGRAAGVALRLGSIGMTVGLGVQAATSMWQAASAAVGKYRGLELGGYFPETQAAVTSRQRNLQAITASNLQARSAIGNEAMLFHR